MGINLSRMFTFKQCNVNSILLILTLFNPRLDVRNGTIDLKNAVVQGLLPEDCLQNHTTL